MVVRRLVPVAFLVAVLAATPASAATTGVTMSGFAFSPTIVKVRVGQVVVWSNQDGVIHSTTGRAPLSLWSIDVPAGATRSRPFRQAGTFAYICRFPHGMSGEVKVPVRATPRNGTSSTTFTIRVATVDAPAGFRYVIQRKAPGGTFKAWKTVTTQTTSFRSSVQGTWRFRAQVKRISDGATSGLSPVAGVTIS